MLNSLQLFTFVLNIISRSDISCYHGNKFDISKIHLLLGHQDRNSERKKGQNICLSQRYYTVCCIPLEEKNIWYH